MSNIRGLRTGVHGRDLLARMMTTSQVSLRDKYLKTLCGPVHKIDNDLLDLNHEGRRHINGTSMTNIGRNESTAQTNLCNREASITGANALEHPTAEDSIRSGSNPVGLHGRVLVLTVPDIKKECTTTVESKQTTPDQDGNTKRSAWEAEK